MGRVVGEVEEKGLAGMRGMLVHDPLLGTRGPEVAGIAFQEPGGDFVIVFPNLFFALEGIMLVAVGMAHIAEEKIEPALGGIRRPGGGAVEFIRGIAGRVLLSGEFFGTLQAPLADRGRGVAGLAEDSGERMVVLERLVEFVVADRGMALGHACEQRSTRRGTDWGAGVMGREHDSRGGHGIELRGDLAGLGRIIFGFAQVLEKRADIAVAKVVGEDEDYIRPGIGTIGAGSPGRGLHGTQRGESESQRGGERGGATGE